MSFHEGVAAVVVLVSLGAGGVLGGAAALLLGRIWGAYWAGAAAARAKVLHPAYAIGEGGSDRRRVGGELMPPGDSPRRSDAFGHARA